MELRHLRYFVMLAEELHFTRAAQRLHIEQPPLSKTIKDLEKELGVTLFKRGRGETRLTPAGSAFLRDTRRLLNILEQARGNVKAIASGLRGSVHLAVSDGAIDPRLSTFLARCRVEEPELAIHLSEVPLSEQLRGLRSGDFALGFAHTADIIGDDIISEPIWQDPLVVAIPARHPLLAFKEIQLCSLAHYPLILCDPQICEGYCHELSRILLPLKRKPNIVDFASSLEMMLTLVGAGYGVGFTTTARIAICQRPDVVTRPLAADAAVITTYLLRSTSDGDLSAAMQRLIGRLRNL